MSALFGLPALGGAWYLAHCRIVAGSDGLLLRGFFKSNFVLWSQIEDYELRVPSPSQSKTGLPEAFLQIGGKWRKINRVYVPYDGLLERIAQEAKWSKARAWQRDDLREDGDWPKTFAYPAESGWKVAGMAIGVFLVLTFLLTLQAFAGGIKVATSNIAMTWSGLSGWGRVAFVLVPFLLPAAYSLIIWAQYPALLTRRRYHGQQIVATLNGLTFTKNGTDTSMRWDEIESYHLEMIPGHFQPTLGVIESRRDRIEFVSGIMGDKTLSALVAARARNAKTREWRHLGGVSDEVLGGAASFWKGGNVGVGPQIRHYRTRSARAFLWFGGLYTGAVCFQLTTKRLGNGRPMSPADFWLDVGIVVFVCVIMLLGILAYQFAAVRCEEDALVKSGIFGERSMRWSEMTKLEFNGYVLVVTGEKRKIRVAALVADFAGLKAEVEKRTGLTAKRNNNAV
jgi:hypothetical protein